MNTKNIILSISTFVMLVFFACNSDAKQNNQQAQQPLNTVTTANIEIIQFHSEHRCVTCQKIEELTKEALKSHPEIPFSLVNVDDVKNEKQAKEFQAAGTALFLYNHKTGEKKELTDFAFMNAGNEEKFITGLKNEINQFGN